MSLTLTIEVPVSFAHPGRGNPKELPSGAARRRCLRVVYRGWPD